MAVVQFEYLSNCLKRHISATAVLPVDNTTLFNSAAFPPGKVPYKTLYLLHGIYNSEKDWLIHTNIERLARVKGIAVVMPSGENRFYLDDEHTGIQYGEYIGTELVEVTRTMFNLSRKREDTFIGGYSMGGYGALMNGLRHPETFSHIISLSPADISNEKMKDTMYSIPPGKRFIESIIGTEDVSEDVRFSPKALLTRALSEKKTDIPKLYISVGTEDALTIAPNRDFKTFLDTSGADFTYKEGPGGHDYNFWNTAIGDALDWLPEAEKEVHSIK